MGNKPLRRPAGATTIKVADLLTAKGNSWDEEKLQQNLLLADVELALQIPLGRSQEDFWAWSRECH
jgi:hypothetical protein